MLSGDLSPSLVEVTPTTVLYQAWEPAVGIDPRKTSREHGIQPGQALGRLSIRRYDHTTGEHHVIADGAHSFARSRDGRLAYVRSSSPTVPSGGPYDGTVEVREDPRSEATETWVTVPDDYAVAGWAGEALLIYRIGPLETLDLYVVERGQAPRLLAGRSQLVAISPDETTVLVTRHRDDPGAPKPVATIDVRTGRVRNTIEAPTLGPDQLDLSVTYPGDWEGDYVVAPAARIAGAVVFRATPTTLEVVGAIDVGYEHHPWGIATATVADDGATLLLVGRNPDPENGLLLEGFVLACARDEVAVRCDDVRPPIGNIAGIMLARS